MPKTPEKENTSFSVVLEVVASDAQDVALADAVRRDTVEILRSQGYVPLSVADYTGKRGGVTVELVGQVADFVWAHRHEIKSALDIGQELISACSTIITVGLAISEAHKKRLSEARLPQQSIKLTATIDETTTTIEQITVEGNDPQSTEKAMLTLMRDFKVLNPDIEKQLRSGKRPKVTGSVPSRRHLRKKRY